MDPLFFRASAYLAGSSCGSGVYGGTTSPGATATPVSTTIKWRASSGVFWSIMPIWIVWVVWPTLNVTVPLGTPCRQIYTLDR